MSVLIDSVINNNREKDSTVLYDGGWYIAKPILTSKISDKVKDAFRILIGKSFAVHYKEDE